MAHDHHSHSHHEHATDNIKVAFFLNLGFTIIEIIGGLFTNSMAIVSDALHDFGDSLTLGLAWYFQNLSKKGRDEKFSYGYKRFSLLGAIINALVLFAGSMVIIVKTVPRLIDPQQPDTTGMIYLAILGILINGLAVLRLKKGSSINERVVSLHLLEDVLGWIAVLIGSIVMKFVNAPILDPLLALAIVIFVLYNVFRNIRKSLHIIMQGIPKDMDIPDIKNKILGLDKVTDVHDIHLWSMTDTYNVLTMHVVVDGLDSIDKSSELKREIKQMLKAENVQHVTIEVENQHDCDMNEC